MKFSKMHGLGNDFVIINDISQDISNFSRLAVNLCDRHFGIGADGIVLLQPSRVATFKMRVFNADGSEAEMCGNAARCLAKYVYERGLVEAETFLLETKESVTEVRVQTKNHRVECVRVDMGYPILESDKIPVKGPSRKITGELIEIFGEKYYFTAVSMGNPHCVIFVPDIDKINLDYIGPIIEYHPLFPSRINLELVQIIGDSEIKMVVWERGVGRTLACGTGACAAVVAGILLYNLPACVNVHLPGGCLEIEWIEGQPVFMSGPAEEVFWGEIETKGRL